MRRSSRGTPAVQVERWVERNGVRLRVEVWGSGPPLLLAHGMWCDAGMFAVLAGHLAREHTVIVPDLRGHGRSSVPSSPWSIADLSLDLAAILDELGHERVALAGFSMGGMAAADFALRFRGRVAQLGLLSTSVAREAPLRKLEILALARYIERAGPPHFLPGATARAAFSLPFQRGNPGAFRRWAESVAGMEPHAMVQALRAVANREHLLDRLGEIRVPSLVVTGTADRVVSARRSREMQRRLPTSRLVELQATGHATPVEKADEIAVLLHDLSLGTLPQRTSLTTPA